MSISTDVAVARLASIRKRSAGLTGGRLLRRLLLVGAVAPVAYAVGARRSSALAHSHLAKIAELERRLEKLEHAAGYAEPETLFSEPDVSTAEKDRIASHYEVLANQLAHEERLRDMALRLAAVERVSPVTTTNS
jgi:hypothetical protein